MLASTSNTRTHRMDRTTPTEPTDDVGRVRAFREALASLLDEDGRPKSAEAVGDEDDDIAITSGHAVRAFVATLTPPVTRTAGEADALADEVERINRERGYVVLGRYVSDNLPALVAAL